MISNRFNRRNGLFALGLVVLLSGGVVVALRFNNFMFWSLGFLVCLVGVSVMRISRADIHGRRAMYSSFNADALVSEHPRRLAWVVGVLSTLALAGSFIALYIDATFGSHWEWPLYAIGVSVFACAVSWGYLAAKNGWFVS